MTEQDMVPKAVKVNWFSLAQIGLIVLILGILAYRVTDGADKPKTSLESYCGGNPADNVTCHCTKFMTPHTRFWTEFNDTTPDIIRTMRASGESPYSEMRAVEVYGDNWTGLIIIRNLTPDYYLIYNFEVVEGRCVEAVPKGGG